jgi:hypothetical protein
MEIYMKENSKMIIKMEKELLNGQVETYMKENSRMIK